MLVIRLNRTGRRNRAHFRLAVQEKTMAPGGKHIELVGNWDPHKKVATLNGERIQYWIGQGAQPSDTVYNLLVSNGVVEGKKRAVKMERPIKATDDQQPTTDDKKVEEKTEANKEEKAEEKVEEKVEEKKEDVVTEEVVVAEKVEEVVSEKKEG